MDFENYPVEIIYNKLEPSARTERWDNWRAAESHLKSIGFSRFGGDDQIWVSNGLPYQEAEIRFVD